MVSLQHCHTCQADPSVPTNTHRRGHTTHTHLVTLTSTPHFPLIINPWRYSHGHSYRASPVAIHNCDPDSEHTCSTLAHHCYLWPLCPLWTLTSASTQPPLDFNPTLLMSTMLPTAMDSVQSDCYATVTLLQQFMYFSWTLLIHHLLQSPASSQKPRPWPTNNHHSLRFIIASIQPYLDSWSACKYFSLTDVCAVYTWLRHPDNAMKNRLSIPLIGVKLDSPRAGWRACARGLSNLIPKQKYPRQLLSATWNQQVIGETLTLTLLIEMLLCCLTPLVYYGT